MDDQKRGLDVEAAEAAMKRAAAKAVYGTREERSGRFVIENDALVIDKGNAGKNEIVRGADRNKP